MKREPIHKTLAMFVVTKNPSDYPGMYVVRRHVVCMGRHSGQVMAEKAPRLMAPIGADGLARVHAYLTNRDLVRLARDPYDDPVIIEVWL